MNIPIDYAWLEATGLAAVRITAFLVIAPPFSYNSFPARVKAMLAVALAIAVAGSIAPGYEQLGTAEFIVALGTQVVVGGLLGFIVMACFSAIQSAGNLIDQFGGFQMAQAFDPGTSVNGAQFTRLFQMIALVLLFWSNGHHLILAGLVRSFTAIPVDGQLVLNDPISLLTETASNLLLAAAQIAGPLIIVLFLADVGLGLMTRVAPALNAFALGFPIKILLTLLLVAPIIAALPSVVDALTADAVKQVIGGVR